MDRSYPVIHACLMLALVVFAPPSFADDYDILIRNGRVLDGTGNPDFRADIAINDDRIVAMGRLRDATADRIIEAEGLFVVPGFIDMHSHADRSLVGDDIEARRAHNLVVQGVTTVVGGPDGRNPLWPTSEEIAAYEKHGIALNFVPMVGHATVRREVMGDDYEREATPGEIAEMQALVRQGMQEGAWGIGAGPEYRPGRFSTTEELIALAEVVAEFDGFYYAHQRSQSPLPRWQTPSILDGWRLTATDGTRETIRIGRETGIRVVGSHIKSKGPSTWGHSSIDVQLIDQARAEGVQVYLDQYPYETFGGGPTGVIPPWGYAPPGTDRTGGIDDPRWREDGIFADYKENLRKNLEDPITGPLLEKDIHHILDLQGGANRHVIVLFPENPSLIGKTLTDVADENGQSVVETLAEFAMAGTEDLPHGALFRPVAGDRFDVENYMRQEYTATSTDGGVSMRTRPGQHPRYYGTYPRKLAHYVRERGAISLAFAIRSSTGLPAQIIGLTDRGYLRVGNKADVVVFDFARVQDRATILEPDLYPEGIEHVLANGEFTVDKGARTGALPGVVLRRAADGPSGTTSLP